MATRSITDQRIVTGIARREPQALIAAHTEHGPAVRAVAGRVCGRTLAEDATQEVFLTLWRSPGRFDAERGSLRSFLLVQAHTRAVDLIRSDSARQRRELRWESTGRPDNLHPDDELLLGAVRAEVRSALQALPMTQRAAIVLAYFGDHTYREVAVLLGESEGTVKSRIRSGLRHLRNALEPRNALETTDGGPAVA